MGLGSQASGEDEAGVVLEAAVREGAGTAEERSDEAALRRSRNSRWDCGRMGLYRQNQAQSG